MRCAYPRCFREASARCRTCRRIYCTSHCSDWVAGPGERRQECELCAQHLPLEPAPASKRQLSVLDVGAIVAFLLVVGLGVAIDVTARGHGLIALWIFAGAFVAFVSCLTP